jgi:CRP-like cAMP-binding protein
MKPELADLLRNSVPMFRGFPPDDIQAILPICHIRSIAEGEVLIQGGTPSLEMYLILSGEVLVRSPGGFPLAQLSHPDTVGEMGIFTGESRSATVVAVKSGSLAVISRKELLQVLSRDPAMAVRMYKNVVDILSHRLRYENLHIEIYRDQVEDLETRLRATQQPSEEPPEVMPDEAAVIQEFYRAIGITKPVPQILKRDHLIYRKMVEDGISPAQIQQASVWTARNIRGVKSFVMVKYCVAQAFRQTRADGTAT